MGNDLRNYILETDYRGHHTAPGKDYGAPLHDLSTMYPEDIYSSHGAQYYGHHGDHRDQKAISIIREYRGKPHKSITVYRAVPHTKSSWERIEDLEAEKKYILHYGKVPPHVETDLNRSEYFDQISDEIDSLKRNPKDASDFNSINPGDWVTTVRDYAVEHGESSLDGEYKILSKSVHAKDIYTEGNSIFEWGYDP